jgi:uncharacterized protein YjbI with pentapeptide repeats
MPYIVIRRYQADTDYRGEMHREVHGFFLPRISRAPGFMAYYALEDVGHDAFVSISVFENRKTAEASNKLAAEFLREWGPGLRKRTPEIIAAGEVGPWQVRQQGEVKADQSQLAVLSLGAGPWNKWRERNPRKEVRLSGAYLSGAELSRVDLSGADLSKANLSRASLVEADLEEAIFEGANLSGAYLSGAKLGGVDLSGADLSGTDLSGAKLGGVDLSEADLSGADLSGANLGSASMPILNRAALEGANLSGANLSGANLSAALRGGPLTQEQIEQATGNEQTKLPEHLKPPASWSQSSNDQQTGDK